MGGLRFPVDGAGPRRATLFPVPTGRSWQGSAARPGAPFPGAPLPPAAAHQPSWRARASYSRTDADTETLSESAEPSIGTTTRSKPCPYQGLEMP